MIVTDIAHNDVKLAIQVEIRPTSAPALVSAAPPRYTFPGFTFGIVRKPFVKINLLSVT